MLEIERLSRRFGAQTALKGVSLTVPVGKVACIVGPSGCGKSTLLRLVAGLDRPDDGRIALGGVDLSGPGWAVEPRRRRLNMVFQDYALWPHMTVARIVGYGLSALPWGERRARVKALLAQMRIEALADRLPAQISGGQAQRVAIARALATDPDLLLFDEPLSNLDVQLRLEMRLEFGALFQRVGKTALYVTHDPLEACAFADILVVMNAGAIEQAGPPETLFTAPRSAWIATLAGYETRLDATVLAREADGAVLVAIGGQRLRLRPAGDPSPGRATVMLRPGDMTLDPAPCADRPYLHGRVTGRLFEGRDWRVTVDVEGRSLSLTTRAAAGLGEAVTIGFADDAALVFPANRILSGPVAAELAASGPVAA
jgi:ABC-type Fe3+/spermidine/putrescine transport system ATPase subunit